MYRKSNNEGNATIRLHRKMDKKIYEIHLKRTTNTYLYSYTHPLLYIYTVSMLSINKYMTALCISYICTKYLTAQHIHRKVLSQTNSIVENVSVLFVTLYIFKYTNNI